MDFVGIRKKLFDKTRKRKDCTIWMKSVDQGGYGKLTIGYKTHATHRLSYEIHKGPIPPKMLVCHTCDIRRCINPDHLFIGTHKDNIQDCLKKNRFKFNDVKLSWKKVDEIRFDYAAGKHTHRSLAAKYGVSKSCIWDILNYNHWIPNIPFKKPVPYKGIINRKKAEEIRIKYKTGKYSQRELAKKYRICQQHVCAIINFKNWQ